MKPETQQSSLFLSLVIPCSRSGLAAIECAEHVRNVLDMYLPESYELITLVKKQEVPAKRPGKPIQILEIEDDTKFSFGYGWKQARGDVLGVVDGALHYEPKNLGQMVHELEQGSDFVLVDEYVEDDPTAEPRSIGGFAIRRNCLTNNRLNAQSYQLLIEALGPNRVREIRQYQKELGRTSSWRNYFSEIQSLFGVSIK